MGRPFWVSSRPFWVNLIPDPITLHVVVGSCPVIAFEQLDQGSAVDDISDYTSHTTSDPRSTNEC